MTLGQLGEYLSDIEDALLKIRDSEIEDLLDELDTNLTTAIEAIGEGPLGKQLTELQTAVKGLISGFEKMNNTNWEEVTE